MAAPHSKASWRDRKKPRPNQAKTSVRTKRFVTTSLVTICLVGLVAIIWFLATRPSQLTKILWLKSYKEITSTLPPLAFNDETSDKFAVLNGAAKYMSFEQGVSGDNFEDQIRRSLTPLADSDIHVVMIRQHGLAIEGKPYLAKNDYLLPDDVNSTEHLIGLEAILKSVAKHPGTTLLLLDWGTLLYDARVGIGRNQFLSALDQLVKDQKVANRIWIFASHGISETSKDQNVSKSGSTAESDTLFLATCVDALLGQRKSLLPGTTMNVAIDSRYLNIADFTQYVTRRVYEVSRGEQRPVLFRGGTGVVQIANDDAQFVSATEQTLVRISKHGRPWGLPPLESPQNPEPATTVPPAPTNDSPAPTAIAAGPADELWQAVIAWNAPDPDMMGWSLAQLAPAAAKELAAHAVRLEARSLAGNEYRVDNINDQDTAVSIASFVKTARSIKDRALLSLRNSSKTDSLFDTAPRPPEDQQWLAALNSLKVYRSLAIRLYDTANLSYALDSLEVNNPLPDKLSRTVSSIITWHTAWNGLVSNPSAPNYDSWATYINDLQSLNDEITASVNDLCNIAVSSKDMRWRLCNALLSTSLPTLEQRKLLRQAMQNPDKDTRQDYSLATIALVPPTAQRGTEMNLLFSESLLRALSSGAWAPGSPGLVIGINKMLRESLQKNASTSELAWMFLDGRDLVNGEWYFSKPDPDYFNNQLPVLPARPTIKPSWKISMSEGSSPIEKLRFIDDKSKQIKLVLSSTGTPAAVKSVDVLFSGVQGRISDLPGKKSYPLSSKPIRISQEEWNDRVVISADEFTYLFDVQPMANLVGGENLAASFTVTFDDPALPPKTVRMPVFVLDKRPIDLVVQEQRRTNGNLHWEDLENSNDIVTMRPFPGHGTPFQFQLKNKADVPLRAVVELYALQQREAIALRPLGRLMNEGGELSPGLSDATTSSMKLLVKSQEMNISPGMLAPVNFNAPAPTATTPATTAPATTPPANATPAGDDATYGMVAIVRHLDSSNSFRTWVEYIPRDAAEFLEIDAVASPDQRKIEMTVSLSDDAGVDGPDLVPVDFGSGSKIALEWITWPWQTDILNLNPRAELDLNATSATFVAQTTSPAPLPAIVPITISVDQNPRALIYRLDTRGLEPAVPFEHAEIYAVERVQLKAPEKGYIYDRNRFQVGKKPEVLDLNAIDAIFPGRINEFVSVLLNIDNRSQTTSTLPSEYPTRFSFGPDKGSKKFFYGDRQTQYTVSQPEDGVFTLGCIVSDWSFDFDFRGATDLEEDLVLIDENNRPRDLATTVLDGTKPSIEPITTLPKTPVIVGTSIPLTFEVKDRSPIKDVVIEATPVGEAAKPIKAPAPNTTGTTLKRYQNKYSINLRDVELPLGKPVSIAIRATDHVGNESLYTYPNMLRVNEKPAPTADGTPAYKGPISGIVKLSTGKTFDNKNLGDNKAVIKELSKEVLLEGGSFKFDEVEAGKYTIEAKVRYQGADHVGEKVIELKKPDDWKQPVVIALKRAKEDDEKK